MVGLEAEEMEGGWETGEVHQSAVIHVQIDELGERREIDQDFAQQSFAFPFAPFARLRQHDAIDAQRNTVEGS